MTERNDAFRELRNRVQCLYLELDASIVRDIMAALENLHAAISAPPAAGSREATARRVVETWQAQGGLYLPRTLTDQQKDELVFYIAAALAPSPEPRSGEGTFDKLGADRLADEVAVLVRRHVIDSRSPAADALLDYRNPPSTPRADRLAALDEAAAPEATASAAGGAAHPTVPDVDVHHSKHPPCPACCGEIARLRAALAPPPPGVDRRTGEA